MSELQDKSILQTVYSLTSLTKRIEEMCGRNQFADISSVQSVLKYNTLLASTIKSQESVMNVVLKGGALKAALAAPSRWSLNPQEGITSALPSITKSVQSPSLMSLAAMEAKTSLIARDNGFAQITSVASQLSAITETLSSQTAFVRELIAPSSMLSDLQSIAERTHKTILDAGNLTAWQIGLLDSASFLADRQIDWATHFCTTLPEIEPLLRVEELGEYLPQVNIIETLPSELEYEKSQNREITPSEALERTLSFQLTEKGKGLVKRIVDINKICQRKKRKPVFSYTNATMMASATLGGVVCTNNGCFGSLVDGLYFVFYENLKHIKEIVTEDAVRNEDVYQCIFRVKDMRTDIRHDYEHGDNIEKKTMNIAEAYSYYTGKVVLTSSDDFITAQDKLYDDFYALTDHLRGIIEKQG